MPLRFLIPVTEPVNTGDLITLDREQAHYISRVMRSRPGEVLDCFDGKGLAFSASVQAAGRQTQLCVETMMPRAPAPTPSLALALALVKGPAMDRALQQAVELGATQIQLLQTARTEVTWKDPRRAENRMAHWEKVIKGACEQCGALYLPELSAPASLATALDKAGATALVFDMSGAPLPATLDNAPLTLFIGPEGGWDAAELRAFQAQGACVYRLGSKTLRAETMPAVALALLQQAQGWRS